MKKIILLSALAVIGYTGNAQKIKQENVPANIMQAFTKMYPDIISAKWELEDGNYEASFKKNDKKSEIVFSSDGKYMQTEEALSSVNDLTPEVIASLKKDFSGYKYENPEKITTADGKTQYEVEAEQGETEYELLYDGKGALQKKTQKIEKEDKEDKEKKEHKEHKEKK